MKRATPLQELLDDMTKMVYGVSNTEAGEQCICMSCKKPVKPTDFRDEKSAREYEINRLCQTCQDEIFEAPDV